MPTKQFDNLNSEKKNLIIQAALKEFAESGVINASTNNIVKNCGISKGSLFKYFQTKDDLCFYLFDIATDEMIKELNDKLSTFSTELFQRIIDYSVWETSWYIKNPLKGRFIISVAKETDKDFVNKRNERYGEKSQTVYDEILKAVPDDLFRTNKSTVAKMLNWLIEGYNQDFLKKIDLTAKSLEDLQSEYMTQLTDYIAILKKGILRR